MVNWKNKEEVREYYRKYNIDNFERIKQQRKQQRKERIKEYNEYRRKYRENNPEKIKEQLKVYLNKYYKKYPERIKSRNYANINNQIGHFCEICGLTIPKLEFHHTNYELNEGFTACSLCHNLIHKDN